MKFIRLVLLVTALTVTSCSDEASMNVDMDVLHITRDTDSVVVQKVDTTEVDSVIVDTIK
tara:strand:- start:3989 stop:4168 length:180 start_codon:yes stop_codon:yes gene_type:complete